jgi:hypothetical protein
MNQRLLVLSWGISSFIRRLMPVMMFSLFLTLECRSQSPGISNTLSTLQQKQISISELDWQLINLNVRRAYEKNEDDSAQPVVYNDRRQRFTTGFFVPTNSSVLRLTSKDQIERFEVEMNGLRLLLIRTLGLSDSFFEKLGMYIEADFVTYESPDFVVIGRYRDGKIQLVHEKLKSSK